jgi:hypothetical protein
MVLGIVVAAAGLSRGDGLITLGPLIAVAVLTVSPTWWRQPALLTPFAVAAGVSGLILGAWLVRQLDTFGTISVGGTRYLFAMSFSEAYGLGPPLGPDNLVVDTGRLVETRLWALGHAGYEIGLNLAGVMAVPPALVGLAQGWRRLAVRPFMIWGAGWLAFEVLVLAVYVPSGTFRHSVLALLPLLFGCAGVGLRPLIHWLRHRLPRPWLLAHPRIWIGGWLAILALSMAFSSVRLGGLWHEKLSDYALAGHHVAAMANEGETLMASDPGLLYRATGHATVSVVAHSVDGTLDLARAYGIRYVVIESRFHPLAELLAVGGPVRSVVPIAGTAGRLILVEIVR